MGGIDAIAVTYRQDEQFPLFGYVLVPAGDSFTISSATWGLVDANGNPVVTDHAVDGNDTGAITSSSTPPSQARAWVNFSPGAYSVTLGCYKLTILISGTGSDGLSRTFGVVFFVDVVD